MNILMFSEPSFPRHPGGAGKCSHILAAALVARGHTVRILCASNEDSEVEQIDGVEVHRLRWSGPRPIPQQEQEAATARYILNYLQTNIPLSSIDVVHDSGGFLSYFFPVEYQLRRLYQLPLVLHFRYLMARHHAAAGQKNRYDPFSNPVLGLETLMNETTQGFPVRFAELVICPSTEDADFVRQSYMPARGEPSVVPDPVDLQLYTPGAGRAIKQELARPDEQLVLFGGRIDSDQKGGDIVISAFKRILAVRPNVRLLLLAPDEKDAAPFLRELGSAATWLGWIRDPRKLAGVFSAVDLVMMPSRYEPFGMMCAEAMAAGTPVVASPIGGLRDMIIHGENGFLFSSPNSQDWSAELAKYALKILSNPELAASLGQNARDFAEARLAKEKVAERIEALYHTLPLKHSLLEQNVITAPEMDARAQARYLALLEELGGPEARSAGQDLLPRWQSSISQRCLACTRQRMAWDTRRLQRLKRSRLRRLVGKLKFREDARHAVEEVCPLGLIQKDILRNHYQVP